MNVKLIIILILITALSSCRSLKYGNKNNNFIKYYSKALKKKIIEEDPLILIDGKSIGLLSKIDYNTLDFKTIDTSNLITIPKGSEYLKKYWGENAQNGIIEIYKTTTVHCGKQPKRIYLLDDKKTDFKVLSSLDGSNIKYWLQTEVIYNKKFIKLTIIITKFYNNKIIN